MKLTEEKKEAANYVLEGMFRLGATLGTWLESDQLWCNQAARAALKAMKPFFVEELERRFQAAERKESGICMDCGQSLKNEDGPSERDLRAALGLKEREYADFECLKKAIEHFLARWQASGPEGSAQWEKFDTVIQELQEAIR